MVTHSHKSSTFENCLWALVFLIFGMIIIGGMTRLTGSGLSIVEWAPVAGILPPITETQWHQEFLKYQTSPEFLKVNFDMSLADFKGIFYLEYTHRLWGRALGIVLLIPTVIAFRCVNYKAYRAPLLGLWALGLAQGLLGWLMVKSGLSQDPHVSHYRLAAHLLMGLALLGFSFWLALRVTLQDAYFSRRGFSLSSVRFCKKLLLILLTLLVITIAYGGLVAGLHAGLIYNTFPLMGDVWIPDEVLFHMPLWRDFVENPVTVQLIHRLLAISTFTLSVVFWGYQRKKRLPHSVHYASFFILLAAILQFTLGVSTLLLHVPVWLGSLHQAGALILFLGVLWAYYWIRATLTV